MRVRRVLANLACVLAVGWPGALAVPAPSPPERQDRDVLPPASVEVVRLDVVVTGKHGRPEIGLAREDFTVLEDGRPQRIVQFHPFGRPQADATAASPAQTVAPAAETESEESEYLLPARYVVLAIDDVHMEFDSLARTRKALTRFLDEDLRPEDQVALVTTSGASALSQEFTADREMLQQTLSRLSAQGRHAEWTGVPYITEYQAELIEGGDPVALDAAIQEILQASVVQDVTNAERIARAKAHAIFTEAVYNARLTLEALERLCRGLSGLTGRKNLLLVSDGFVTGIAGGSGAAFDLRRITDAATRAGVAVYSLDTRGLVASSPVADASSRTRIIPEIVGSVEAMRQRSEEATRGALHTLAADTGGFLVEKSNDLRAGLRHILKDTETYYVLAYESTNTKRDGAFRRIEVRVPGRRDLRVRTRSGYFAPDDRRLTAPVTEASARRQEQRESEMRAALGALFPLKGIPVRLSADFVSLDGAATQLVVTGSVDVAGLPYARRHDRRQATVETAALVYDEGRAVVSALPTDRTALDLTDANYAQLLKRGLPYQHSVSLKPGRYQVRLAAREDATDLLGSAWQRVEVPDLAPGQLAISSLFLLKDDEATRSEAGADNTPVLHTVQDRPRFSRAESLYVQLYAYNVRRDEKGAVDVVSQPAVLRSGAVLGAAGPEPMVAGEPGQPVFHLSRIRLQRFESGDYELRVTVTDRKANAIATRTVPFTVE